MVHQKNIELNLTSNEITLHGYPVIEEPLRRRIEYQRDQSSQHSVDFVVDSYRSVVYSISPRQYREIRGR